MTRQEFLDDVNGFSDLLRFCSDEDLDACSYVKTADELDEWLNDTILDWAREMCWTELRDQLDDINTNYDYYDTEYGVEGIDYDFERYKWYALEEADELDIWDEEEDTKVREADTAVVVEEGFNADEFAALLVGAV